MSLRITLNGKQVGPKLRQVMRRHSRGLLDAVRQTADLTAQKLEIECRADIASAGNFGKRWTDGLTADVTAGGGHTLITVRLAVFYWRVFEFGATIEGKPLLWIPLSFGDAQGISARDFPQPLFRVNRKSRAPLLLSFDGKPQYFGKESVTIPKKFHLREISRDLARGMADTYRAIRQNQ